MWVKGCLILSEAKINTEVYRIEPSKGWLNVGLGELWSKRELLFFFTLREVQVRYKQTVIGFLWAILQPLLTMVVFSLFFGELAEMPSDGIPYPIFSYAALVPWTMFSSGISAAANSVVVNRQILTRVYLPRLILPSSSVLAVFIDFLLAFAILLLMMLYFGIAPTMNVIFLPALVLLAIVSALGVGFWLSAMNVQFRDIRYTLPFITQLWLFITPIAYPSSLIENESLKVLYGLNPMAGVVEGFRWALLGADSNPQTIIVSSTAVGIALFISGLFYFRSVEKTFADVI